jgi:hypothetical protein
MHRREKRPLPIAVDPNTGVARIPVERAKELILERGLPGAPTTNQGVKTNAKQ